MAACSLDTLTNDAAANRFTGVLEDRYNAVVLQLLCDIKTALGMASCNVDTLISDAATNRFTGVLPDRQDALVLQLLCDIKDATVSSAGGLSQGAGAPVAAPVNPAVTNFYYDTTAGVIYAWNTTTQAWE